MSAPVNLHREGSLEAPTRHPLDWKNPQFHDEAATLAEMQRVFDICHGCRRCVSLCNAFPTLFDLVDNSTTQELDGVAKRDYWQVADHCYLCDLCYMTKCPYVPPHPWALDFPHLMLRAKAVRYRQGEVSLRDRVLTSTRTVGALAGIPVVAEAVNRVNAMAPLRKVMEAVAGISAEARLPPFAGPSLRSRLKARRQETRRGTPAGRTQGRVVLFATCYCDHNEPHIGEDLVAVFEHNGIPVASTRRERCCGMPKMELGNLDAIEDYKRVNIAELLRWVDAGWDVVAPVPSCVLMFKSELPLLFPDDGEVRRVAQAVFDPFEYLMLRHRAGLLRTDFRQPLGKIAYHVPCHLRVQNMGLKSRELLSLIPGTEVEAIERCSGHNGTYAVKAETHGCSVKIGRPVFRRVQDAQADHYGSDCPMAGTHIAEGVADGRAPEHPLSLLRLAYGL